MNILNKIIQGDCLQVMKDIPDQSIDMVLTDPPYGVTNCKWDSVIPLEPMWEQLIRIIKLNGAIVLMAAQPFTTMLISSNLQMFRYCWVWEKTQATGHLNAWKRPLRNTEDICVFYKKQPTYNPELINKPQEYQRPISVRTGLSACYNKYKLNAHKCPPDKSMPRTIITFNNEKRRIYPTQKPVDLGRYLVRTYTNPGEIVLDFATGTGTFCIAALLEARKYIGIELDAACSKIAEERINTLM